jgi:hypothetical protein
MFDAGITQSLSGAEAPDYSSAKHRNCFILPINIFNT